jgi:hypothetical protein
VIFSTKLRIARTSTEYFFKYVVFIPISVSNLVFKYEFLRTDGNSWNTGPAPPPPPYTAAPPPTRRSSPGQRSNGNKSDNSGSSSGIGGGGIAGIIIAILVIGVIVAFFVVKKKKSRASREEHFEQHQPFKFGSNDVKGMERLAIYITSKELNFLLSMYLNTK